jgi:adenine C2-methylase RlmN of 23S rRNA A2503 and tRNA A37
VQFDVLTSAEDASVNFVSATEDGGAFEARFVQREDDYFIVYLSSHSGCDRACRFCHLTQTGQTMMEPAGLTDYIRQASEVLAHYASLPQRSARKVNFNFMARGEPLANPTVLERWNVLRTSLAVGAEAYGLKPSFNVSTIYPKEIIDRPLTSILGYHPKGTVLYYSLYSMDPDFRRRWLPKAADPHAALSALRDWQRTAGGDVVIHYAFIEGQNDSDAQVDAVIAAILDSGIDCRFNLVRYNPYSPAQGREPPMDVLKRQFARIATACGQEGSRIVPRVGFDVKASCGMFVEAPPLRRTPGNPMLEAFMATEASHIVGHAILREAGAI